jgi:hypothetical protein
MMKKAIFAFVAVGSVLAIGVIARRKGQMMREHCEQMAERCKQVAERPEARDEAVAKV